MRISSTIFGSTGISNKVSGGFPACSAQQSLVAMSKTDQHLVVMPGKDMMEPADKLEHAEQHCDRNTSITGFVAR
jgi:hypothetical protein